MTPKARRALLLALLGIAMVVASVWFRGAQIGDQRIFNPDEIEMIWQGRQALGSPTPFSDWTMGSTGPVWGWFLAFLGALGFPLTVLSAHLLAAVLVGVMGFFAVILLQRSLGTVIGTSVGLLWWLAYALVYPLGRLENFGALNTEMVPMAFVLGAALIPVEWLNRRPWLFLLLGLLCGLGIGAKYQVLPVAFGLVLARLVELRLPLWRFVRLGLLAIAGVAVPFAVAGVMMLVDPRFEPALFQQWFGFLGGYTGRVPFLERVQALISLTGTNPVFWGLLAILAGMSFWSSTRMNIMRWSIAVLSGLAVFLGGNPFPHYMIIWLGGLVIAVALPPRPDAAVFRLRWVQVAVAGLAATFGVFAVVGSAVTETMRLTTPSEFATAMSRDSMPKDPGLAAACPSGTSAFVWGWAPELYVADGWTSTFAAPNVYGLVANDDVRRGFEQLTHKALDRADCFVDAVGPPFFGITADQSIRNIYPWSGAILDADFRRVPDAFDCEACSLYVRK